MTDVENLRYRGTSSARDLAASVAAAARLRNVDVMAVWSVESSLSMSDRHGFLIHRFEPHLFFRGRYTWRDSLGMSESRRLELWREALAADFEKAVASCSWGPGQILGLHFRRLGYASATAMVTAWAADGVVCARDFTRFLQVTGLDVPLRLGDLLTFARGYNGRGQPEVYARKLRAAYVRVGGEPAGIALSLGSRGDAVERVQNALGVPVDGFFGPLTQSAVEDFQRSRALVVDGIVGPETWGRLFPSDPAPPDASVNPGDPVSGVLAPSSALNIGSVIALAGAASEVQGYAGVVLGWSMVLLGGALVLAALVRLWRDHRRE